MKISLKMVSQTVTLLVSSVALQAQELPSVDSLPPSVTMAMVERKEVFEGDGLCAKCHGPLAGGMLDPDLTDSEWWHAQGSYLSIVRQILVGVPASRSASGVAMVPRGGSAISDGDVQAVAAYVWKLSHTHAGDSLPLGVTNTIVARGRVIFGGVGNCATCHGADSGGLIGPDLTDNEWLHAKGSYLAIVQQVLMGVPAEASLSGVVMPPRGGSKISDADVHAVAAYVWVLSRRR